MQTIKFSNEDNIYIPRIEDIIHMESSLFNQVYNTAKGAIDEIIRNNDPDANDKRKPLLTKWLNMSQNTIIAFAGERGSGKTSAMLTVANALDAGNWINGAAFNVLPPVEPSHLSERETLLDIVVSRLYNQFNEMANSTNGKVLEIDQQRIVLEKFVDVHNAIRAYHQSKETRLPIDSGVENLSFLASGNDLNIKLYDLIKVFLDVRFNFKKANNIESNTSNSHFLVLCIDDLDLNLGYGYKLCEEIRKYFSLPNVLVLLSCKLEQLSDSIKQRYIKDMKVLIEYKESQPSDSIEGMAVKYLDKLVPVTHRCYMPLFNVQTMREIKIKGDDDIESFYVDKILNLLFQKTGVVLLKNRFGSHHFIPNQLREMVHLYALLFNMDNVDFFQKEGNKVILNRHLSDKAKFDLAHNLSILEEYIRDHVKVQSMKHCYRKIILETMEINWEELNQRVCRIIKDEELISISNTDGSEDICSTKTIAENVSIGDTLYFLNRVSEENNIYDAKCFKAFMKILYSIVLVRQLFLSDNDYKNLRQLLGGLIYNPQGEAIVRGKRDFQPNIYIEKVYNNTSAKEKIWLQLHVVSWGLTDSRKAGNHWLRSDRRVPYTWDGFRDPSSNNYKYFTLSYLASLTNILLCDSKTDADGDNNFENANMAEYRIELIDYVQHYLSPIVLFSADYIDAFPSKVYSELEKNKLKSGTDGSAYYTAMVTAIQNVNQELITQMPSCINNQFADWFKNRPQFPLWTEEYYIGIKEIWGNETGVNVSENAVKQLHDKLDAIRVSSRKDQLMDILNLRSFPRNIMNGKGLPNDTKDSLVKIRNNNTLDFEDLKAAAEECINDYLNELKELDDGQNS